MTDRLAGLRRFLAELKRRKLSRDGGFMQSNSTCPDFPWSPTTMALILCGGLAVSGCQADAPPAGAGATGQQTGDEDRQVVQRALDRYVEGLVSQDADRIPLASDVIFVEPDGTTETTFRGIEEVVPFLERQTVDSVQVHATVIDGEYGCELTDYYWSDGPKMPIALCLRVVDAEITEIRPYFDRTLFSG